MKLRFFSDIHLERDVQLVKRATVDDLWRPSVLVSDPETVLVLAGDIWNGIRPLMYAGRSWMNELSERFKAVVIVFGNHDFWGENLNQLHNKWRRRVQDAGWSNVYVLESSEGLEFASVLIDGVRFVGSTLWTNMGRGDSRVLQKFDFETGYDGRPLWNDRNYIRAAGYSHFAAKHWLAMHCKSVKGIEAAVRGGGEPVVLVTHHAPCMNSAASRLESESLAGHLYASDLSEFIWGMPQIKHVIHGHTHDKLDYMMGDVRIMCNPRGYAPSHLVDGFEADGVLELELV